MISPQLPFEEPKVTAGDPYEVLDSVLRAWKAGLLGGELMPEDAAPTIDDISRRCLFFTLPMALNYQRNSYTLWHSAAELWNANDGMWFAPSFVGSANEQDLRAALVSSRVALQPNKHVDIWRTISSELLQFHDGSVLNLISSCRSSVALLSEHVQGTRKKAFPYLSGPKIFNYWLYVLEQYCSIDFPDRDLISVAPDTHVLKASVRLGLMTDDEAAASNARDTAATRWREFLAPVGKSPIDVHSALWLWSRAGFPSVS
jgi:hypothetical protein